MIVDLIFIYLESYIYTGRIGVTLGRCVPIHSCFFFSNYGSFFSERPDRLFSLSRFYVLCFGIINELIIDF